jgi:transposase
MPDALTPSERALIDAAVAQGRVTQVPRGVSGLPQYFCDPETGKLVTGLGQGWKDVAKARGIRMSARRRRLNAAPVVVPAPAIEDRIEAAVKRGDAPRAIAKALGVNSYKVYRVIHALRRAGRLPPVPAASAELTGERLAQLHDSGLTYDVIATRFGVSRNTVAGKIRRFRERAGANG